MKRVELEEDEMRPEYDFSELKGRVRGKYAERYRAGANIVLLEPDIDKNRIQLPRLNIFLRDFRQSYEFAVYILKKSLHNKKSDQSKLVHLAFNTSLIISYSRPFGGNKNFEGQTRSSLKPYVSKILTEDEIKLHDWIIDRRHTEYAHSRASAHLFEGLNYDSKRLAIMKVSFKPLNKSETDKLKAMIEKWIIFLEEEKSKLRRSKTQRI